MACSSVGRIITVGTIVISAHIGTRGMRVCMPHYIDGTASNHMAAHTAIAITSRPTTT